MLDQSKYCCYAAARTHLIRSYEPIVFYFFISERKCFTLTSLLFSLFSPLYLYLTFLTSCSFFISFVYPLLSPPTKYTICSKLTYFFLICCFSSLFSLFSLVLPYLSTLLPHSPFTFYLLYCKLLFSTHFSSSPLSSLLLPLSFLLLLFLHHLELM